MTVACALGLTFFTVMSKFLKSAPRVLVMLSPASEKVRREKFQGILKYARLHGPWDVQLFDDRPFISKLGDFANWRPDGIITRGNLELFNPLIPKPENIPTVYLDADPCHCHNRVTVRHDLPPTSHAVAEHYLRQGLAHFAYVGSAPDSYWSAARGDAFAKRVQQEGFHCVFYEPQNVEDWGLEQRHMRDWLTSLPKPCGLFAAFDLRAKQVLDTCLSAGLRVPEEIAIIGVDNDETICENTVPTLSSVQPDLEGGGYLAAERLDLLMRGKKRKRVSLTYGPQRIVHRQSSQCMRSLNRLAMLAVEFIRLNACEDITVPDVARHLSVSRSFAEKSFRKSLGHSLLEEIQKRRLQRICLLLRETTLPIGEIGIRCGYSTEPYLKRLFKRTFGITMREYRRHPALGLSANLLPQSEQEDDRSSPSPGPQREAQVSRSREAQVIPATGTQTGCAILKVCEGRPLSSSEIAAALGHKTLSGNLRKAIPRLKAAGLLEYTLPSHPRSRFQRYRLTDHGRALAASASGKADRTQAKREKKKRAAESCEKHK